MVLNQIRESFSFIIILHYNFQISSAFIAYTLTDDSTAFTCYMSVEETDFFFFNLHLNYFQVLHFNGQWLTTAYGAHNWTLTELSTAFISYALTDNSNAFSDYASADILTAFISYSEIDI